MNRPIEILAIASGGAFLGLALLTAVEVLVRKAFSISLVGVDELGGYIYAIGSAAGFIVAFRDNAHVRIDLLISRLPAAFRTALHLASYATLGAFVLLLAWRAGAQVLLSWDLGATAPTPLRTPLVVPQGIWFLLLSVFAFMVVLKLVSALDGLLIRRLGVEAVARQLDISPRNAELEKEIASIQARRNLSKK